MSVFISRPGDLVTVRRGDCSEEDVGTDTTAPTVAQTAGEGNNFFRASMYLLLSAGPCQPPEKLQPSKPGQGARVTV